MINRLVESELHDRELLAHSTYDLIYMQILINGITILEQGTTEMLSKHWMPLDEYTKHAMEGLQRGDFNIIVPHMKPVWEKLEKERIELSGSRKPLFASK